jgi:uncharacterized phiE125 gp8 family phage protein
MQIIMLSTRYGSEDGFVVRRFLQNYQYEIADSLGAYFIRLGVAVASSSISGRGNIFLKEKIMSNNRERLLERISAPATEPITLAEAKLYLRVDSSSEDNLITDLIVAARMSAEAWLKNSLISQSWKLVYNDYLDREIILPMPPIVNIGSVVVVNRDTTTQTISPTNYYLNAAKNKLLFDNYISGFSIEIIYNTGYGTATQVPSPIKYGILAHIAAMYDERGLMGQVNLPPQVSALYSPFRELSL